MARLEGMVQICDYVKRSDATVLSYIRQLEFPAVKLGSIWIADTKKIDSWFHGIIENGTASKAAKPPVKKRPKPKKNAVSKKKKSKK